MTGSVYISGFAEEKVLKPSLLSTLKGKERGFPRLKPSFVFSLNINSSTTTFVIEYKLAVTLKSPGLFRDRTECNQ